MPAALSFPRKGVSWGASVDEKENEVHPVLDNLVAMYDYHGNAKDVLYLQEVRGKFKNRNPSKVVVKVEACTVSRMDCQIRRNVFHHHVTTPHVSGTDMVGTIVQVGSKVKRYGFQVGDRVCALDLNLGGNARYVIVHCSLLIKVPPALDSAEVACLIRTYVTAYQCLHRAGDTVIREGDKVLVVGGAGCIGQATIQLAKAAGAKEVWATGADDAKTKRLFENLGAQPLGREVWKWLPVVEGDMDIVIDSVDGYNSSHKALNTYGKLVILGDTSQSEQGLFASFLSRNKIHYNLLKAAYTMDRTAVFDLFEEYDEYPDHYERDLRVLFRMLEGGEVNPKIIKCIPLSEVDNAHTEIEEGGVGGAIVCLPFSENITDHVKKPPQEKMLKQKDAGFSGESSQSKTRWEGTLSGTPPRETREEWNSISTSASFPDEGRVGVPPSPTPDSISTAVSFQDEGRVGAPPPPLTGNVLRKSALKQHKNVLQAEVMAKTEKKRLEAEMTVAKMKIEGSVGIGGLEAEKTAAMVKTKARRGSVGGGILKESSYARDRTKVKIEKKLSIDEDLERVRRAKVADATAADIQARKLQVALFEADAKAKRAEAEALKAQIEAKRAKVALLTGVAPNSEYVSGTISWQ
eukprot:CAMPEP_0113596884 /NCGR_PEP_ID=MMETSP0015_2-20120614/40631_1 /TAXON_ID=2838 /ORGANISM="Odontella" /LENGTH=633 /DNA_ID=CAMNT_0000504543 /DNA_START=173 /DNA_END=2074 /DNA_ORIENTATION=- /assembly_acc=CAM_ASM_000160